MCWGRDGSVVLWVEVVVLVVLGDVRSVVECKFRGCGVKNVMSEDGAITAMYNTTDKIKSATFGTTTGTARATVAVLSLAAWSLDPVFHKILGRVSRLKE